MEENVKKSKASLIIWPIIYVFLAIALCVSGGLVFHTFYYDAIFVDGDSMNPTLCGNRDKADFGIADHTKRVINSIRRFDIVTTYYPFRTNGSSDYISNEHYVTGDKLSENATYKIKRIIALPGETFKIEESKLYIKENNEFKYIPYTFSISVENTAKDIEEVTLGENDYWVLGDNRSNSADSGIKTNANNTSYIEVNGNIYNGPIHKENITGVLIAIEGTCKVEINSKGKFYLTNKHYTWPRYMRG